jgi:hypothetical protein
MKIIIKRFFLALFLTAGISVTLFYIYISFDRINKAKIRAEALLAQANAKIEALLADDQRQINLNLQTKIASSEAVLKSAIKAFEDYKDLGGNKFDGEFAAILADIAAINPASAQAELASFSAMIKLEKEKKLAAAVPANMVASLPQTNAPPDSGYRRQVVEGLVVDIIAADLNSTRVVVETAADGDCRDNCPVLPLAEMVARAGGYAGVNGTYFCPAAYPSCAGKTNSFDLLVMNRQKKYFNSENNVYSVNPAVAFYGNTIRFMERASDWGRATDVDAVLSNFPLLLLNGQIKFSGDGDAKHGAKGNRSFIAGHDSRVFIGVVHNATVAESAQAMSALGLQNAINLDDGGSTALVWGGAYKVGPGRNLANGVVLVRK